jgi:hypothetical protein
MHGEMEESPDGEYVKYDDAVEESQEHENYWRSALAEIRDAVLHERYQLSEAGAGPDVINAVLGIIDDCTPAEASDS